MTDWLKYKLSDFLLFSPRVYERLFVLHNQDLWPWQIVALALGIIVIVCAQRGTRHDVPIVFAIHGAAWLVVADVFFPGRYQTINWLGSYIAPLAALQGAILIVFGLTDRAGFITVTVNRFAHAAGFGLLTIGLFVYPLLSAVFGQDWRGAQVFGLAPDPTAIATLGALALLNGKARTIAAIVPAAWCIFSALTLWTLDRADYFFAPGLLAFALAAIVMPRDHKPR